LDVIRPRPNSGSYAQFNYRNGQTGLIVSPFDANNDNVLDSRDGRVAYASFGFESVSYEYYVAGNPVSRVHAGPARRDHAQHHLFVPDRYARRHHPLYQRFHAARRCACACCGGRCRRKLSGCGDGSHELSWRVPAGRASAGRYEVYAYRRGFTIQHSAGIFMHGAFRAGTDLLLSPAPSGVVSGKVFAGGDRTTPVEQRAPLADVEVQVRDRNPDGTWFVSRGTSGADGTYNIPGVPFSETIGYQVVATRPTSSTTSRATRSWTRTATRFRSRRTIRASTPTTGPSGAPSSPVTRRSPTSSSARTRRSRTAAFR
jgi:hypothetical protein